MITRNKSLFAKKIKCSHCGSGMKRKVERGNIKYICSSYDNKGECVRVPIEENYLVELIEKRMNQKVTRELIDEHVKIIMVENIDPYLLEIHFHNQESILFSRNLIRY